MKNEAPENTNDTENVIVSSGSSYFIDKDGEPVVPSKGHRKVYWFGSKAIDNLLRNKDLTVRKIGDTWRAVNIRHAEWNNKGYHIYTDTDSDYIICGFQDNVTDEWVYVRDHSFHAIFKEDYGWIKFGKRDMDGWQGEFTNEAYYDPSGDISKSLTPELFHKIIENTIKPDYELFKQTGTSRFKYSSASDDQKDFDITPIDDYLDRGYQTRAIKEIVSKHKNSSVVLFSAPPRCGKCYASMRAAEEELKHKSGKVVLIVSAILDVKPEWQKTVQGHKRFGLGSPNNNSSFHKTPFAYLDANKIDKQLGDGIKDPIAEALKTSKNVAVFFSLQDMSGSTREGNNVKDRHKLILNYDIYLIADEVHYAAFSPEYGKALGSCSARTEIQQSLREEGNDSDENKVSNVIEKLQEIKPKKSLYVTATPHNILTNSSFTGISIENTVFVTPEEIKKESEKWIKDNPEKDPAYSPLAGMPEQLAFAVNAGDIENLMELNENGGFVQRKEVKKLIKSLWLNGKDGETNPKVPNFFTNEEGLVKSGAGIHLLFILKWKKTCDAFEKLLWEVLKEVGLDHKYDIFNISSYSNEKGYSNLDVQQIKNKIASSKKKTITLTVNKMTTGVSVPKWDTVVIMTNSKSITRELQIYGRTNTPRVETTVEEDGSISKEIRKEYTAIIHFSPFTLYSTLNMEDRMYRKASDKSLNINERKAENEGQIGDRKVFSFETIDNTFKITEMKVSDIDSYLHSYLREQGISEYVNTISIDIDSLNENNIDYLNSTQGIKQKNSFESKTFEKKEDPDLKNPCNNCTIYNVIKDNLCAGCWNKKSYEKAKKENKETVEQIDISGNIETIPFSNPENSTEKKAERKDLEAKVKGCLTLLLFYSATQENPVVFSDLYYILNNKEISESEEWKKSFVDIKNAGININDLNVLRNVMEVDSIDRKMIAIHEIANEETKVKQK